MSSQPNTAQAPTEEILAQQEQAVREALIGIAARMKRHGYTMVVEECETRVYSTRAETIAKFTVHRGEYTQVSFYLILNGNQHGVYDPTLPEDPS